MTPHTFLRAGLLCVALATLLLSPAACTERRIESRGSWGVERRGTWSLQYRRRIYYEFLFQRRGSARVLVAADVRGYSFYPNDCIIYYAHGPGVKGDFAACGLRVPLRISGPDGIRRSWRQLGHEFQLREHRGNEIYVIARRSIADILTAAQQQPIIAYASR